MFYFPSFDLKRKSPEASYFRAALEKMSFHARRMVFLIAETILAIAEMVS